jgi:hypothetical protein
VGSVNFKQWHTGEVKNLSGTQGNRSNFNGVQELAPSSIIKMIKGTTLENIALGLRICYTLSMF